MGIDTAKESSWFNIIRNSSHKNTVLEPEMPIIGIMSFEISRLMTKIINLWQCLSDKQISQLKQELANSTGIQKLVSDNQGYLTQLTLIEIVNNIKCVAKSVARLGKKCIDPVYHNLDHIFDNPFEISLNWSGWEYRLKKIEKRVKKMKRFVSVTSQLHEELEVLSELENNLTRMQNNDDINQEKLREFQKKVMWQREEVNGLREMSTWVRTYDYIVRLLVRSLFTILERVKGIFGIKTQMGSHEVSDFKDDSCFVRSNSFSTLERKSRILARVGSFRICATSKADFPCSPWVNSNTFQTKILLNAQKATLGDAALALHYAKVIIFIERLSVSPHLISREARDELYDMLTTSIKNALRAKLNILSKNKAFKVYNCGFASDLSSSMKIILDWLSPLAHNMIKWHSERNFEKECVGYGGNVLLVNTLYYADQEKSEDAIIELVTGLHYISRFGREINDKAFMGSDCDDYWYLHKGKLASITL